MRLNERTIRDLTCPAGMTERSYFDDEVRASACACERAAPARGSLSMLDTARRAR